MSDQQTDFGFEQIPFEEKQSRVNEVFHKVASRYDCMNDAMSLGLHRLWKHQAIMLMRLNPSHQVLDLAGGTGDLSGLIAKTTPHVVLGDINRSMLEVGRDRPINRGLPQIKPVHVDAQALAFQDNSFDRVIIGFGLRNVPDKALALREMHRVLKPSGMLLVLEFSEVPKWLAPMYDLYSFKVLPWLGQRIAQDKKSYQYLAESIRKHPNQEQLKSLILEQGYNSCHYHNLSLGIVAIHQAFKGDNP